MDKSEIQQMIEREILNNLKIEVMPSNMLYLSSITYIQLKYKDKAIGDKIKIK